MGLCDLKAVDGSDKLDSPFLIAKVVGSYVEVDRLKTFLMEVGSTRDEVDLWIGSTIDDRAIACFTAVLVRRSCIRVFIVSNGWQILDSTRPAVPPAIKCRSGFFAFFLFVLLLMLPEDNVCASFVPVIFFTLPLDVILNVSITEEE